MWIVLLIIAIFVTVGLFFFFISRKFGFPYFKFYIKGKDVGFTFTEINLLRKVAIENRLKDPLSLFWSVKQLDRSIRSLILKYRATGEEDNDDTNDFLSKLFEFRKRVEFDLPKYKLGLKTTRDIANGQKIRITLPGTTGPFFSTVLENLRKYLAISYPRGPKLPIGFNWRGQQISIYFWRKEDAGYSSVSKVLDDYIDMKYPILHIAHTNSLYRTQKRRSVRVDMGRSALIFPLRSLSEGNDEIESSQGLRCKLMDLSEGGAELLIGGRAKLGLPIKVQFELLDHIVVMNGTVKGVNFDERKNRSTLHIQSVPLSKRTRNIILSYVYNIFGDRDEEEMKKPESNIRPPNFDSQDKNQQIV
jgi:c-di-GMP-binding flagellar brake protein YcgR